MKRKWWIVALIIVLVGGAYLGYSEWLKPRGARAQTSQQVTELVVVERGTLQDSIEASGNLTPARERSLIFETQGRVAEVYVTEGDRVTEGQPLVRLDATSLELTVESAEASLAQAQVQLEQVLQGPTDAEIAAAEAALSSAKASYAQVKEGTSEAQLAQLRADVDLAAREVQQAQGNYERSGQNVVVGLQLQDATWAYEQAQLAYEIALDVDNNDLASAWSKVEQAQIDLDEILAGPTDEEVEAAELNVERAEISLQKARRQLENMTLVTPFDGTITQLNAVEDEMLSGTVAVIVADLESLEVDISLDEVDVTQVSEGQTAGVAVEALDGLTIPGEVLEIAPQGETTSGVVLYPVTVGLMERPDGVRVGMTVDVEIIIAQWEDVLYLPQRAIKLEGDGAYVMVQKDSDEFERVSVVLGKSLAGNVEIVQGVSEGDVVGVLTEVATDNNEDEAPPMPGMGIFGGGRP
ncbi:MAG: efflux RND transporter periplasmic adaptor subunit [Anaerolineae bacterium]